MTVGRFGVRTFFSSLFFSIVLAALMVVALPAPALAQFGAADLTGTWRIHGLGLAPTGVETGGWGRGSITMTAGAVSPGGTVVDSEGEITTATGGRLSVSATGAVSGSVTSAGEPTTTVQGQMVPNKQAIVLIATSGSGASLSVNYAVLVRAATSGFAQSDLGGSWRIFGLETPWDVDTSFGGWVRGTIALDATGVPSGGSVRYSDGGGPDSFIVGSGGVTLFEDGRVEGTVSSQSPGPQIDDATVTGVMLPAKDFIVGVSTSVARGNPGIREFGFFFLQRVPEVTYSQALDLPGRWQLHGLSVNAPDGDTGFGLLGPVTFTNTLTGSLATRDAVSRAISISPSTLALDAQGNLTGSFNVNVSGIGPLTVQVDASMLPTKDVIVGVLTIRSASTGDVAYALFSLVKQPAVVQFSVAAYRGNEGATVPVTLTRTGALANNLTVELATTTGTATPGADYTALTRTVTFPANVTTAMVNIQTAQDTAAEDDETVGLVLRNPTGGAVIGPRGTAVLTIVDDEQSVAFGQAAYVVSETGKTAQITLRRSGPPVGPVSVDVTVTRGTATPGVDYTAPTPNPFRVTFASNQVSAMLAIPVRDDLVLNGSRGLTLALSNPLSAGDVLQLGTQTAATLTITDNEQAGVFGFGLTGPLTGSILEGGRFQLTINRRGTNLAGGISVRVSSNDGSAEPITDFTPVNQVLTFGVNETSKSVVVQTTADSLAEVNKTVVFNLSEPGSGATIDPARSEFTLTIINDDQGGVIQFAKAAVSVAETVGAFDIALTRTGTNLAGGVTVEWTPAGGTAAFGTDWSYASSSFTFGPGQTSARIPITVVDNGRPEGNKTFTLELRNPSAGAALGAIRRTTITILDDEQSVAFRQADYVVSEAAGTAQITVVRTGPPAGAVSVQVSVTDNTAAAGTDYTAPPVNPATLTFASGQTSAKLMIPVRNDTLLNGSRSLSLELMNPVSAGNVLQIGTQRTATVSITDNEQAGVFGFGTTGPLTGAIVEGGRFPLVIARRGMNLAGGINVRVMSAGGSVDDPPGDYTVVNEVLTFRAGETSKTIFVQTTADRIAEPNETIVFELMEPGTGATIDPARGQFTLTITNDDQGGVIQFATAMQTVSEAAGTIALPVTRTGSNLASDVTVGYEVHPSPVLPAGTQPAATDDFTLLGSGRLTFAAGESSKTISVRIENDTRAEAPEAFVIRLVDPTGGATLGPSASTRVTITSDDVAGATVNLLSDSPLAPGRLLTLTGTGFDPALRTVVRFSDASGYALESPAFRVTSTSLMTVVPPYVVPGTETFGSATVDAQVVQRSGTVAKVSNVMAGFEILELPETPATPGAITVAVLEAQNALLDDVMSRLATIQTTSANTVPTLALRNALTVMKTRGAALRDAIEAVMADPGQTRSLGAINGEPMILDQTQLAAMDRLLAAWVVTIGPNSPIACPAAQEKFDLLLHNTTGELPPAINAQAWGAISTCTSTEVLDVAERSGAFFGMLGLAATTGGVSLGFQATAAMAYTSFSSAVFVLVSQAQSMAIAGPTRQGAINALEAIKSFQGAIVEPLVSSAIGALNERAGLVWDALNTLPGVSTKVKEVRTAVANNLIRFFAPDYLLTLATSGIAGSVSAEPAGSACGARCYSSGTVVTLTATPQPGSRFKNWSGACSGTNPTCTVTMSSVKSATAVFEGSPLSWALTGTVTVGPETFGLSGGGSTPRAGGSFPFTAGPGRGTARTTATMMTLSGSGFTFEDGVFCSGFGSGSGPIVEGPTAFTVSGSISGSATCTFEGESEVLAVSGSFTATAPK